MSIFKKENGEWVKKTAFQMTNGVWEQISSSEPDIPVVESPLVYTLSSDGTYYIVGTGFTSIEAIDSDISGGTAGSGLDSTWSGGSLRIPATHNGLPVKGISPRAFQEVTNITDVYIEDGITIIGHRCFQVTDVSDRTMTSCRLPETLTSLGGTGTSPGGRVLWGRGGLTYIKVPQGIVIIPQNMFRLCVNIKTIDMPNVTRVELQAFYGCGNLETVNMPKIEYIGQSAFSDTKSITLYDMSEITKVPTLWDSGSLTHKSSCVLRVPNSLLEEMQQNIKWSSLTDVIWEGV